MSSKGSSTLEPPAVGTAARHEEYREARNPYPELDLDVHVPTRTYWWAWVLILGGIALGCYRLYVFETAKQTAMASPKTALIVGRPVPVVAEAAHTGNMPVYLDGLGRLRPPIP